MEIKVNKIICLYPKKEQELYTFYKNFMSFLLIKNYYSVLKMIKICQNLL